MKMYHLPFGDWSGDGHREFRVVPVKCEDPNTFKQAEDKIKAKYGEYFFSHMADDFGDATVGEDVWQALLNDTDYTLEDFIKTDEYYDTSGITSLAQCYQEFKDEPMSITVVINMYLALVRAYGAKFEIVPDVEMITNVAAPGYGCLGD